MPLLQLRLFEIFFKYFLTMFRHALPMKTYENKYQYSSIIIFIIK